MDCELNYEYLWINYDMNCIKYLLSGTVGRAVNVQFRKVKPNLGIRVKRGDRGGERGGGRGERGELHQLRLQNQR